MQIYVPDLNAIFVPILKNASRSLTAAVCQRWPNHMVVGPNYAGERVVMWRDPKDRIESTYRMMRDGGLDMPFAKWVTEVCKDGLRDPHLKPQIKFCDSPSEIFKWDFDGFRKFFRIKKRVEIDGESNSYPCVWDERAEFWFRESYRFDIRIWAGFQGHSRAYGKERNEDGS